MGSVSPRWRTPGRVPWCSCLHLLQDNPIGDWDGVFDGKLLCNFASLEHTRLVPICDVMSGKSPSCCCWSFFFFFSNISREPVPSILGTLWVSVLLAAAHRGLFVYMAHLFWKSGEIPGLFVPHCGILICLWMLLPPTHIKQALNFWTLSCPGYTLSHIQITSAICALEQNELYISFQSLWLQAVKNVKPCIVISQVAGLVLVKYMAISVAWNLP